MKIGNRTISPAIRPYIIAEISANHAKDANLATKLVEEAKMAGADAVKIQAYTAEGISFSAKTDETFLKEGPWAGKYLVDLYREAETPRWMVKHLFEAGQALDIPVFASVFDLDTVDFLETLGCPAYKIASFELTDVALIKKVAETDKPMILSTGMGSDREISDAVYQFRRNSGFPDDICVLHCISAYPTPHSEANLPRLGPLSDLCGGLKVGISDHTMGLAVPVVATGMGICVIEKHFTLSRAKKGPDSAFSMEPDEFGAMTEAVKQAWEATKPSSSPSQTPNSFYRRGLYAKVDLKKGSVLTAENVCTLRPQIGVPASAFFRVLGREVTEELVSGQPILPSHVSLSDIEN